MRHFENNPFERLYDSNPYTPNLLAQRIAAEYCAQAGFPEPQPTPYVQINPDVSREIAKIYEETPDMSDDLDVQAAYKALVPEIERQFAILPVQVEPYDSSTGEPYKSSQEMMDDVLENNHLWVFSGGEDHSFFTREQNFKFRSVHDYFGHAQHGYAFGPRGEENAWIEHSKMFSPLARAAMTTETRGQNSWVNFGPYSSLPPTERPYAEQKAILLPIEFQTHPVLEEAYRMYSDFYPSVYAEANNPVRFFKPKPGVPGYLWAGAEKHKKTKLEYKKLTPRSCMLPSRLAKIREYFETGREKGLNWYKHTYQNILEMFNNNVERTNMFILFLAATSPLENIRENVNLALKSLRLYDIFGASKKIFNKAFRFKGHRLNLMRAMIGEPLEGPKVTNFAKALLGITPDSADAVTVDRWIARAFGGDRDTVSRGEYRCIEKAIRKLAAESGVEARQYQAAVWTGIKLMEGDPRDTVDPFERIVRAILQSGQREFDFDIAEQEAEALADLGPDSIETYEEFEKALGESAMAPTEQIQEPGAYELEEVRNPDVTEEILDPGERGEWVFYYHKGLISTP